MTELELLRKARAYLPDHWTQGVDEDHAGNVCARGAILKYDPETFSSVRHSVLNALDCVARSLYHHGSLVYVNDKIGLEAVLFCYDTLIARLEEHEKTEDTVVWRGPNGSIVIAHKGGGSGNGQVTESTPELATV